MTAISTNMAYELMKANPDRKDLLYRSTNGYVPITAVRVTSDGIFIDAGETIEIYEPNYKGLQQLPADVTWEDEGYIDYL